VLPGQVERVGQRDDAELFAVNSDDPDFAGANFAVDPDKRSRRKIAWRKRAAQDTLVGCGITVGFRIKQTGTASSKSGIFLSVSTRTCKQIIGGKFKKITA
jgi:hypothetical protein